MYVGNSMSISHDESGERRPNMDTIKALAEEINWSCLAMQKAMRYCLSMATAIGGASLFPADDACRELEFAEVLLPGICCLSAESTGFSCTYWSKGQISVAFSAIWFREIFISRQIRPDGEKASQSALPGGKTMLFSQLVFRAVCEKEISVQKGAELLGRSFEYVAEQCFGEEWCVG